MEERTKFGGQFLLLEAPRQEEETSFEQRFNVANRVCVEQNPALVSATELGDEAGAHFKEAHGAARAQLGVMEIGMLRGS